MRRRIRPHTSISHVMPSDSVPKVTTGLTPGGSPLVAFCARRVVWPLAPHADGREDLRPHDPDLRLGLEHAGGGDLQIVVLISAVLISSRSASSSNNWNHSRSATEAWSSAAPGAKRNCAGAIGLGPLVIGPDEAAGKGERERGVARHAAQESAASAHHDVPASDGPGRGGRRRLSRVRAPPDALAFSARRQPRDHHVERRDDEDGQHGGRDHAREHGGAQRAPGARAGPGSDHERQHAQDEREGGHEDRDGDGRGRPRWPPPGWIAPPPAGAGRTRRSGWRSSRRARSG